MYRLTINGTNFEEHAHVGFSLDGGGHIALRCDEYYYTVYSSAASKALSFAFFDIRATSQLQAGLNICRTFFVCLVLGMGAMMFSKDANDLVLKPIERMVKKVRDPSINIYSY
jgi:hypothetical protein